MAKVSELRAALEALAKRGELPEPLESDFYALLGLFRRHDDMSVASFLQMMARANPEPAKTPVDALPYVESLRKAFRDDDAFRAELKRIQSSKQVSRETLNEIYEMLSGRSRKLPSKATKAKLAQDIADFRLERVRSERAAEMFKGKPAFAE
jgi:hypothetical protein